ncbi:MAG: methyltransferase domain-containing protein [Verrucomicrobiota bacterium]|jgi:SAM-dependent methyltransferase
MIIHRLILQYLGHRDDPAFYEFQAADAVHWLLRWGVRLQADTTVLDLGCGHGVFGAVLAKRGCQVTFADECNSLLPELAGSRFLYFNLDQDHLARLGSYDLVICSNVYEHLAKPDQFLQDLGELLKPNGKLFLSWTNWLSLWGGHEFSPFHYLGARRGHLLYDRFARRPRKHTPYQNLFPTYIGQVLKKIRAHPQLKLLRAAPRYYPELSFILRLPVLREFLTWNCALLIGRRPRAENQASSQPGGPSFPSLP